MPTILIINGPNLNMLGQREPEVYGHKTLADIKAMCVKQAATLRHEIEFKQSNHEGEIIDWIQQVAMNPDGYAGIIINPAAYTHTSIAIHDALKLLEMPIIEVHLTDPATREDFRHHSYVSSLAAKIIKGQGAAGYSQAIEALHALSTN